MVFVNIMGVVRLIKKFREPPPDYEQRAAMMVAYHVQMARQAAKVLPET